MRVNDAASERFRGWVFAAIAVLLITGIYNYLHTGAHTPRYHILLGIKLLLALHVFASVLLAVILIAVYLSQIA
jgi:uncharacterized membrane protein